MRCAQVLAFTFSIALAASGCDGSHEPPPHLKIEGGDVQRGAQLIQQYGCGTCHLIDRIPGAVGAVGPPLINFASRTVLAGRYPNAPRTLVPWLMNPEAMRFATAMPNLGISAAEARDIASFLYTQGAEDTAVFEVRPTEAQYPWLTRAKANRFADGQRLTETKRVGPQHARIPVERAMDLLVSMPDAVP